MNWETGLKRGPFLRDNALKKEAINIRMTGCPNDCPILHWAKSGL